MTTTLAPEIARFAAAVRAALSDLPPDDVDDLTDGLEADLAERHADDPDEVLGDPGVYAAELRAAAGHPPRAAASHLGFGSALPRFRTSRAALRDGWRALLERHPLLRGTVAMLVSLRPLWWVFRGAVIGTLVGNLFPGSFSSPFAALVIGAAVVVSVQFGRGRWLPKAWMRRALLVIDVLLAVAAPFLVVGTAATVTSWSQSSAWEPPYYVNDLMMNGVPVGNVFAYDADGNPIESVQLFDQNGQPLNLIADTGAEYASGHGELLAPSDEVTGRTGWNVYPLRSFQDADAVWADDGTMTIDSHPATWPFPTVQPLTGTSSTEVDPGTLAEGDH